MTLPEYADLIRWHRERLRELTRAREALREREKLATDPAYRERRREQWRASKARHHIHA